MVKADIVAKVRQIFSHSRKIALKFPVGARLIGVGAAVPPHIVTNADIEKLVETTDEWITARAGICPKEIDLVIATSIPDCFRRQLV